MVVFICLEQRCQIPRLITDSRVIVQHNKHDIRELSQYIQSIRQDLQEDGLDDKISSFQVAQTKNQDQLMKQFELAGQTVVSKIKELQKSHIQRAEENMEGLKNLIRMYDDGEIEHFFRNIDKKLEHVLINYSQVISDVKLINTFGQVLQNMFKESQTMLTNFMTELQNFSEVTIESMFKESEETKLKRMESEQKRQIDILEEQLIIIKSIYQPSEQTQQKSTPEGPQRDHNHQLKQANSAMDQDMMFLIVNVDKRMQIISSNAQIQDDGPPQKQQLQLMQLLFLQRQQPNFKTYNDFSLKMAKKFNILSGDTFSQDSEILTFTLKFLFEINLDHAKLKQYVFQITQIVLEHFQDNHFVLMKEILEQLQIQCVIHDDLLGQSESLILQGHLSFRLFDYKASKQFYQGGLDYIKSQPLIHQESMLKILRYNKNFKSLILNDIFQQLVQSLETKPNEAIDVVDVFEEFQGLTE